MEGGSTKSIYLNPALSLSIALGKQLGQIRQSQFNMVKQYNEAVSLALSSPFVEFAKNIREMQLSMAKSLLFAVNPHAVPHYSDIPVSVQEAEVFESDTDTKNISILEGGLFAFDGKIIRTISTNSKQGKFFKMLLTYNDNYVSDQEAVEKLDIPDIERGMSYIRRDLKRDLLNSNFKIELYRHTNNGYSLINIKRLPN